jgi:hypothetical protein
MQQPTTNRTHNRSYVVTAPGRRTRWVLTGQKDYFQPGNPADAAEYHTVCNYRQR